ncbi:hypothetical protein [Haloarchaeobius sp. HME9146]|uniref:hypothetical protein n=1 Tax=Haloarchaeobius sp. HME9146 TaxID=2978732 RepID=UPI0021BE0482|nr:hypothetical protein [Haloarchaeobius sp. HME9146]MCT9097223.1 hypothetical protein [Haloarchaeobius sp. HME9146]
MSTDASTSYDGLGNLPLRFVVWVLAAILLGRLFQNNSLYDLRQLRAEQVLVRLGSFAVLGAFVYWLGFLARPDIAAIVIVASAGFIAMWMLPWLIVRIMVYATDNEEYADARKWEAITAGRKFD